MKSVDKDYCIGNKKSMPTTYTTVFGMKMLGKDTTCTLQRENFQLQLYPHSLRGTTVGHKYQLNFICHFSYAATGKVALYTCNMYTHMHVHAHACAHTLMHTRRYHEYLCCRESISRQSKDYKRGLSESRKCDLISLLAGGPVHFKPILQYLEATGGCV